MLNVWRDLHFSRNCLWKTNWNCWPGRPWRASCWFIRTLLLSMKTERPERFNAVASNGYRIRKIPYIRGVLVIIYCLTLVAQYLLLNSSRLILVAQHGYIHFRPLDVLFGNIFFYSWTFLRVTHLWALFSFQNGKNTLQYSLFFFHGRQNIWIVVA